MEQARLFGGMGFVVAAIAATGCPALNWDFQGAGSAGGASNATSTNGSGAAAMSSSSTSATVGAGGAGGMGPASWNLYSFNMGSGKWLSETLSSVWANDKHAPPTKGIVAATHLAHFNRLLVFADDGMFYLHDGVTWKPPVKIGDIMSPFKEVINPAALNTAYHVPSDWDQNPMMRPLHEDLFLVENPSIYQYTYSSDDQITYVTTFMAKDESPPGPKQASGKALWSFDVWNWSQIGTPEGYVRWWGYDDGYVYKLRADFMWEQYLPMNGPLWVGKPGAPPWGGLQAAYFIGDPKEGIGTIYFIGP
jgi:hypothetical protein